MFSHPAFFLILLFPLDLFEIQFIISKVVLKVPSNHHTRSAITFS